MWLTDEEFSHLDGLIADFREAGRPVDPRIRVPAAAVDPADLPRHMEIRIEPT